MTAGCTTHHYACACREAKLFRKPAHGCPEWDYLHIKPGDPEMEACTCTLPPEQQKEQEVE